MSLKTFTRKDIAEIRQYLVELIDKIDEAGRWTDRNESDIGMVIVELIAGAADQLNFYIDKQALETYLPTVSQRKNMKRILSLVGYEMKGPVAAVCDGLFTLTQTYDFSIPIPKYFQVSYPRENQGNIYYATAEDCQIPAGASDVHVGLRQGIVMTVNLTVADLMYSRTLTLRDTTVAEDSVILTVGGKEWECVPDVLVDDKFGEKFSVHEDIYDQTYIELGYSWKDFLPADYREPVQVKYLSTAGGSGAVSHDLITEIDTDLIVNDINIVPTLMVTNLTDAGGGADRESMETARIKAPQLTMSRKLMTTLEDYIHFAEDYPGIYKAQAIDWTVQNSKYVSVPYKVDLYLITTDNNTYAVPPELCSNIKEALKPLLWSSIDLTVMPATVVDIDLVVEVYTSTDSSNWYGLHTEIEDIYRDFFRKSKRSFNEVFTNSQLENLITNQSNLAEYVQVLEPDGPIRLKEMEFPRLNKLDVYIRSVDELGAE